MLPDIVRVFVALRSIDEDYALTCLERYKTVFHEAAQEMKQRQSNGVHQVPPEWHDEDPIARLGELLAMLDRAEKESLLEVEEVQRGCICANLKFACVTLSN